MTVAQYLFAYGLTRADLGKILGIAGANISSRLHGKAKWTAEDLLATSTYFGVSVDALMPSPDGMGGWVPAPYTPGARRAPVGATAAGPDERPRQDSNLQPRD